VTAAEDADAWAALDQELAQWRAAGRIATLWWRDDDAEDATENLDRLLDLAAETGLPLALAIIPARATAALAARLDGLGPAVGVLQHGYAHTNHAAAGEKKCELGRERPYMGTLGDLATGRMALESLFGARALPVLVPPWNRIAPALVPTLPEIGFRGLSRFKPRLRREPVRGLIEVNAHADPVAWKAGGAFAGDAAALLPLVQHLAQRRAAAEPGDEPTGVLSHHRQMDAPTWDFLRRLLDRLASTPGVRWPGPHEIHAPLAPGAG
jgi:hypothetical protein